MRENNNSQKQQHVVRVAVAGKAAVTILARNSGVLLVYGVLRHFCISLSLFLSLSVKCHRYLNTWAGGCNDRVVWLDSLLMKYKHK